MTIALSTFIGIVLYHIRNLQQVRKFCCNFKAIQYHTGAGISTSLANDDNVDTAAFPHYEPFNEDREPLLANNDD